MRIWPQSIYIRRWPKHVFANLALKFYIFDGGPTVECELENIRSVKESRLLTIRIGDMPASESKFIISNTKLAEYRATSAYLSVSDGSDEVVISPELADGLMVNEGEQIRILAM